MLFHTDSGEKATSVCHRDGTDDVLRVAPSTCSRYRLDYVISPFSIFLQPRTHYYSGDTGDALMCVPWIIRHMPFFTLLHTPICERTTQENSYRFVQVELANVCANVNIFC